jgi:hypothetical protein
MIIIWLPDAAADDFPGIVRLIITNTSMTSLRRSSASHK